MNNYDKLKSIIKQAQPDRDWRSLMCKMCWRYDGFQPIRLADVLLVTTEDKKINEMFTFSELDDLITLWNKRDDDLDHQSEETKQFLINLLTNE